MTLGLDRINLVSSSRENRHEETSTLRTLYATVLKFLSPFVVLLSEIADLRSRNRIARS